jgi:Tfp pilus assembly protein PilX
MGNRKQNQRGRERGIALISVLLVLVLLIAIGVALMYMTDTDTAINANYRREQQSYFAAKAGIEEVRDRMRRIAPNTLDDKTNSMLPKTVASDTGGVLYVINQGADPTAVEPWTQGNKYMDDELCHDGYTLSGLPSPSGAPGPDVACANVPTSSNWYNHPATTAPSPGWATSALPFASTAAAVPYKWVRITWKQNDSTQGNPLGPAYYTVDGSNPATSPTAATPVCWDGKKENLLPSSAASCEMMSMRPVYLATSFAFVQGSRRMIQSELAKTDVPMVPAALALDGPNPSFNSYSSNNSQIIGNDASSSQPCPPAGNWPAIGVYDTPSVATVTTSLFKAQNYTGTPAPVANIGPTATGSNAPGTPGNLNQLSYVSGLLDLVNTITQSADVVYPASVTAPPGQLGTVANPQITVFSGDLNMSGQHVVVGAGILLVEGTYTISGSPEFDGLVLVIGKGIYYGNGDAVIGGQTLVANISSGVVGQTPGPPLVNLAGGGGQGGTYYDSCKANLGNDRIPYQILATREVVY